MDRILVKTKGADGKLALSEMTLDGLVGWFKAHTAKDGTVNEEIIVYRDAPLQREKDGRPWVMSDMTLDRDQEEIDPEGWDLKEFKKNPVLLWSHDWMIPAIGHVEDAKIDKKNGKLMGKPVFDPKEVDEFAWMIGQKVEIGTLNAGSVGFKPNKVEIPGDDQEQDVGPRRSPDKKPQPRLIYRKQELWEFSICNIPSNPNARVEREAKDEKVVVHTGGMVTPEQLAKAVQDGMGIAKLGEPVKGPVVWSVKGTGTLQHDGAKIPEETLIPGTLPKVNTVLPNVSVSVFDATATVDTTEASKTANPDVPPSTAVVEIPSEPAEAEDENEDEDAMAKTLGIFVETLTSKLDAILLAIESLSKQPGVAEAPKAPFYNELFRERKTERSAALTTLISGMSGNGKS